MAWWLCRGGLVRSSNEQRSMSQHANRTIRRQSATLDARRESHRLDISAMRMQMHLHRPLIVIAAPTTRGPLANGRSDSELSRVALQTE